MIGVIDVSAAVDVLLEKGKVKLFCKILHEVSPVIRVPISEKIYSCTYIEDCASRILRYQLALRHQF